MGHIKFYLCLYEAMKNGCVCFGGAADLAGVQEHVSECSLWTCGHGVEGYIKGLERFCCFVKLLGT